MRSTIAASAFLVLAGLAVADVTFTEKTKESKSVVLKLSDTKQPHTNTVFIKDRMLKFSETDAPGEKPFRISIFDGATTSQKDANPRTSTYSEIGAAEIAKRAEAIKPRLEDLEAKVDVLTGDKQARTKRYIWLTKKVLGMLPTAPKVEFSKTGEKEKIGTWDCERVVIKEENEKGEMDVIFDCWMTEKLAGWTAYADMFAAYKAFSPGVLEKMKEVKGFHVKGMFTLFYFDGDGYTERNEVDNSDVKETAVSEAEFTIPSTFKKK